MNKGLTSTQAKQFLNQYGLNIIASEKKKNIFIKFIEQFNNFLIILLLIAAILSFFIGESIDGILILGIVIINAIFGFYQEIKAEEAIESLRKMTIAKVRVIRDGREEEVDSKYLVPGDIVFVEEGIKIPADGIIVEARNLEINEAILTGESLAIIKNLKEEVFMGTIISKGRGLIKITKTGMNTKFGQIAGHLQSIDDTQTPLQKKLTDLSRTIGIMGILLSTVVFILSIIQGTHYFPAFLLAISLAVAVVPEGLPAVMTITLSIGVKEMSKRKAIIRKLSAIEALGSITLIATDKTGTLTTNQMKVKEIYVNKVIYTDENLPNINNKTFSHLITDGIVCSTASLVYKHDHGDYDILGDPTEGALLLLSKKIKLDFELIRKEWIIIDEKPFDSVTKIMSVVCKKNNNIITYSKGAPESIINISKKILINDRVENMTDDNKNNIENTLQLWTKKGYRVLAFSFRQNPKSQIPNPKQIQNSNDQNLKKFGSWNLEIGNSQVFLGMVAIHDSPRPEVKEALRKTREAGINVVMITGDNEKTAEAIGLSIGLIKNGDDIITGKQIEEYSDQELLQLLPITKIFARTTPIHKYRIVKLYQQLGEIVAVTGDGVNDAIALKQADVGIAMGLVGTDVARETADMIITDDNFATIVNAIEEGRIIIRNLKNVVKYLMTCNITEAFALIVGLFLGLPGLFCAIQFLYINLVTDGIPALALSYSPREDDIMKKKPKQKLEILETADKKFIIFNGIIATFLVIASYFVFKNNSDLLGKTAAFTVLVLIQSFIFVDMWLSHGSFRRHIKSLLSIIFLLGFALPFVAQFTILQTPFLADIFKIQTITTTQYLEMIIISGMSFVGIKGVKSFLKL